MEYLPLACFAAVQRTLATTRGHLLLQKDIGRLGAFAATGGHFPQLEHVYHYCTGRMPLLQGTFAATRGHLPLLGDVCRYRGTFAATEGDL